MAYLLKKDFSSILFPRLAAQLIFDLSVFLSHTHREDDFRNHYHGHRSKNQHHHGHPNQRRV